MKLFHLRLCLPLLYRIRTSHVAEVMVKEVRGIRIRMRRHSNRAASNEDLVLLGPMTWTVHNPCD